MKPRDDILVLGLGSPFGDDRLGWEAVARLAQAGVAGAVLVRDGVDLLLELEGHDEVIVIDASNPAGCPGRVRKIEWPSDELGGDAPGARTGSGLPPRSKWPPRSTACRAKSRFTPSRPPRAPPVTRSATPPWRGSSVLSTRS